jgi:predicted neuraminidase
MSIGYIFKGGKQMAREIIELNTLTRDGRLYKNNNLDTIEALIPNPYVSSHAADLLELPNKDLLCCWFAGSDEGNADISIYMSRLNAGSSQWTVPIRISDDNNNSEQNPSLFLNENGDIWAVYTSQGSREDLGGKRFNLQYTSIIKRKISKDNGYTWGEAETMFGREGSFCRQKIQVLSNGRWIFGNWICFNDDSRNGTDITVMQISENKGATWREVEVPGSKGRVHPTIIELEKGNLIALFRSRNADNIYLARSMDYGDTWTEPMRTELPNNNASISAVKLQSGRIAVIYNHFRANDDPDKVMEVMNKIASNLYKTLSDDMKSSTLRSALTLYNDKEMTNQIKDYKSDLSTLEDKLQDVENRYYKQFSAMETAMAKLNSQSSSLASMLGK